MGPGHAAAGPPGGPATGCPLNPAPNGATVTQTTTPVEFRALIWRASLALTPASTGAGVATAARGVPAVLPLYQREDLLRAAVTWRAHVLRQRAKFRPAAPYGRTNAARVEDLRARAADALCAATGATRWEHVPGAASGPRWLHHVEEDWTRYSKSWHRDHGPARTVVTTLAANFDAVRRTPPAARGSHGGLVTLTATPAPTPEGTDGQWYAATWRVPHHGAHATVAAGLLGLTSHGAIHAATPAEGVDLWQRREARHQAALRAATPEGAARRTRAQAAAQARTERRAAAVAWWLGWPEGLEVPEDAVATLARVAAQPETLDRPVTAAHSKRAGNCADGTAAWAHRHGLQDSAPVRVVLGAAVADYQGGRLELARRAVAAVAAAVAHRA